MNNNNNNYNQHACIRAKERYGIDKADSYFLKKICKIIENDKKNAIKLGNRGGKGNESEEWVVKYENIWFRVLTTANKSRRYIITFLPPYKRG